MATDTKKQTGVVLKKDPRQMQFKTTLESNGFREALRTALPRHIQPARMIRVVLAAMQQQPKLLECNPDTVFLSIMRAASCGLEPDGGALGHGYLVPFWSGKNSQLECQFIPGYRGLVQLARNSGDIKDVIGEVVYEKDHFEYELGLAPILKHKRNDDADDPGGLKYAYAIAEFRDGGKKFIVMNKREVLAIKARTQSKTRDGKIVGPWKDDEAEQWKKTAVRRICKQLPLSADRSQDIAVAEGEAVTRSMVVEAAAPVLTQDPQVLLEQPAPGEVAPGQEEEPAELLDFGIVLGAAKTPEEVHQMAAEIRSKLPDDSRVDELLVAVEQAMAGLKG